MSGVADVLKAARARIEKPEHWTQGAFARNALGRNVHPTHPSACCFCVEGAVRYADMRLPGSQRGAARTQLDTTAYEISGNCYAAAFNDAPSTTHADVLALFDRAIEREEGS
jgi:hypothetical protein